jgi:hypothetical protein
MSTFEFFRLQTRQEVLALVPRFVPEGNEVVNLAGGGSGGNRPGALLKCLLGGWIISDN